MMERHTRLTDGRIERRRSTQNWILRALPPEDFTRLSQSFTSHRLQRGDVLAVDPHRARGVYFMMSGACSAMLSTMAGAWIEVACISCDGVTSAVERDMPGFRMQLSVTVAPASAIGLGIPDFESEMDRRGALWRLVTAYYRSFRQQLMLAVGCNRLHSARARCCRKLLMLADRCGTDALNVTQATLATMLGISRPSLTLIALDLKRRGMIDYVRDAVVLLDRPGLERAACECYRVLRDLDRRSPLRH